MNTAEQDTERMFYWIKILGTDYAKASGPKKKQMKRDYAKTMNKTPSNFATLREEMQITLAQFDYSMPISYGNCSNKVPLIPKCGPRKDTPMSTTYTPEMEQRSYLQSRMWNVEHNKQSELRKQFHMDPDPKPVSGKDIIDRITSGKYMLEDTTDVYGEKSTRIVWRDPATPADKAGFDAALAAMRKAQQDTTDIITVMPPADGLAALRAFESTTIH